MRTSKTPLPTSQAGSQPSAVQVWPAQCTRVHVQADHFNEPHGGSQPLRWEGRQRQSQPRRLGDWGRKQSASLVTERGQSQEEKTKERRRRQQGAGKTPCVWKSLLAHQKLLSGFSSVVCRGQQRNHLGTYWGGPRHSWAGLEFWSNGLTSLRTIGQAAEHSGPGFQAVSVAGTVLSLPESQVLPWIKNRCGSDGHPASI